jgi:acetyl-CoA carboxylase biotin carboxyl carrier protein
MANDIKYKIKSFYEIMKEENVQKLEITSKNYSIYIKRKDKDENTQILVSKEQIVTQGIIDSENNNKKGTIKSPITGVFYRFSFPSSSPFVNEGEVIEVGRTICIIEAMKVMNEIKATFRAKILETLVENGKLVSPGQDLFEIEKI